MKEIIFEWNPWWLKEYNFTGIKRDQLKDIVKWIERREIVSIIGVRRAGKTTLFYEIIDYIIKSKGVDPKRIFFIKSDDDRVKQEKLIDTAIDEYQRWVNQKQDFFLFIDEIQEIPDWQKTLKRIYDLNENIKIFISGSNSSMLKEDLGSLLAGRFSYFEIFPFNLREFLAAKGIEIKNEADMIRNKNVIRNYLAEYIENGSFPEVVLEENKRLKEELVRFYFDSIFYRDILKRRNIRNPAKMEKLVKYLLHNISNLMNFSKIARLLELTTDSITEYVRALEDSYLIFSINLYEFSYKKQIINPKKIYCVDSGIRNIVGFNFSSDIGRLYENVVFVSLRRRSREIYYWKGKKECDFIVKSGRELEAVQVCYDASSPETKTAEMSTLLEAMEKLKIGKGTIITDNYEAEEEMNGRKISFIPLWKWLLE